MGIGELGSAISVGSASWARARLAALAAGDGWSAPGERDLVEWLYVVATRRAEIAGIARSDRSEVAQDAMPRIINTLNRRRERIADADNPAAFLERVVARAVASAIHRYRMAGFGGVSANGRNWRKAYPRTIGGELGQRLLETNSNVSAPQSDPVVDVTQQVANWTVSRLDLQLIPDAVDAIQYVMDRLAAGVGRGALIRGNVALARDPAMQHLGLGPAEAGTFARWLLGRTDAGHIAPAVLDAALSNRTPAIEERTSWRRSALGAGIAHEVVPTTQQRTA